MKKIGIISMASLMLGIGTLNSGCFGSFSLTLKLYDWNKSIGSKFGQSVVFWVFNIIPVYGVCGFIDVVILNLVEFWSGSNPLAMKAGEKEQQIVMGKDGNKYEITATQNRFDIVPLNNKKSKTSLIYTPVDHTWNIEKNGTVTKIATIHEDINKVEIFQADGSVSVHDMNTAQINSLLQSGLSN